VRAAILARLCDRNLWVGGGLLLLANAVVALLGFARAPITAWLLPQDEVGVLGVIAAWLPFAQLLTLPGLDQSAYQYMSKGHTGAFRASLSHRARWSLASALVLGVGAIYWWRQGQPSLAWVFLATALFYPATAALSGAASALSALADFRGLFLLRVADSLVRFAGFAPLLLSVWWGSRVVTYHAVNLGMVALLFAVAAGAILRRTRGARLATQEERAMLGYGRHQTAITAIGVAQSRTDGLLVGMFLPLETMADYTMALAVQDQLHRLWNAYLALRYPPLVRLPRRHRQRRILFEGGAIWLAFAGVGLGVCLLAAWLVPVLLPAVYARTVLYIWWLVGALVAGVPGAFCETYFRTVEDARTLYVMSLVGALTGVAFPALLLARNGAMGVVAGRFYASVLFSLLGLALFVRAIRREAGT